MIDCWMIDWNIDVCVPIDTPVDTRDWFLGERAIRMMDWDGGRMWMWMRTYLKTRSISAFIERECSNAKI